MEGQYRIIASHGAHRLLAPPAGPTPAPLTARPRSKRLDWATLLQRTFACDVWACGCGGRRRVVAFVTRPATAQLVLEQLGLLVPLPPLPLAQAPPQLQFVGEP